MKAVNGQVIETLLNDLDLPSVIEGDQLYFPAEGEPRHTFYDPNGHPLPGEFLETALAAEALWSNGENHFMTSLWAPEGVAIWVSTVYLAVNHQFWPGVPALIWETMITSNFEWTDMQWRYCTKAAAQSAHQSIITALLSVGCTLAEMGDLHE